MKIDLTILFLFKCWLIILLILILLPPNTIIFNKYVWYNQPKIIDWDLDGPATSQQILDIYSITHISHGIIFFLIFQLIGFNIKKSIYLSLILDILYKFDGWTNVLWKSISTENSEPISFFLKINHKF